MGVALSWKDSSDISGAASPAAAGPLPPAPLMPEEPMPELPTALLTESRLDEAARHAGDLWLPDHPYFDAAEADFDLLWRVIEPFLQGADFGCVLDLATGRGRNARKLLPLA